MIYEYIMFILYLNKLTEITIMLLVNISNDLIFYRLYNIVSVFYQGVDNLYYLASYIWDILVIETLISLISKRNKVPKLNV